MREKKLPFIKVSQEDGLPPRPPGLPRTEFRGQGGAPSQYQGPPSQNFSQGTHLGYDTKS